MMGLKVGAVGLITINHHKNLSTGKVGPTTDLRSTALGREEMMACLQAIQDEET
jgi:hypothetical protein